VNLYFNSQLEQTYQGSGSQSYTWNAPYGASGEVSYQASAPNTCSVSYSPSQSFSISPGNSYTETITITCQGQQPPPPPPPPPTTYGCFLTVQGQTNPSEIASVSVNPTSTFVPSGQTQTITAYAPLQVGGNPWYEFDSWSGSVTSGPGSLSEHETGITGSDAYSTWIYTCPSGLTSNETATVSIKQGLQAAMRILLGYTHARAGWRATNLQQ